MAFVFALASRFFDNQAAATTAIVSPRVRISPPMQESTRRSAHEIFEQVVKNAREELSRSVPALLFSGFAGGIGMGLTGLGVALALSYLGNSPPAKFISLCFYPIGFIVVIIG
ncbi:MAG TPA: formate/nitrite transporter family protein, partial [Terriglobales bacterium]|nr:formate/nitrite transporter family protein [Terriglobales bacterium]